MQIPKFRTVVKRFGFYGVIALMIEHNLDVIVPWVAARIDEVKTMAGG